MSDEEFKIKEEPKKRRLIDAALESIALDEMVQFHIARIDMFVGTLLRAKGVLEMDREFAQLMDNLSDDMIDLETKLFNALHEHMDRANKRREEKNGHDKRVPIE